MDIIPSNQIIPIEPPVDIWERFPGEGIKAYAAFTFYLKLPPDIRSIRKAVREKFGTEKPSKVRLYQRWSTRYHWVNRAIAWDDEVARKEREEQLQAIKDMKDRHKKIGGSVQALAIQRLKTLDPSELTTSDILKFLEVGAKLERLALGQPTEIAETKNINANATIDFTSMTDDELRKAIAKKLFNKIIDPQDIPLEDTDENT